LKTPDFQPVDWNQAYGLIQADMATERKRPVRQPDMWIPSANVAKLPGHPFYERLNQLLREHGFDCWVEDLCEAFYAKGGRGSIVPGVIVSQNLGRCTNEKTRLRIADGL
jgi:hypothetical protein